VAVIGLHEVVERQHRGRIACRLELDDSHLKLVEADFQKRIVQFARQLQRPELVAFRLNACHVCRRRASGPLMVMVAMRASRSSSTDTSSS
jgi:hypothetical protein